MKKNIVITILAILVLGMGGYLVYDKVLSNDNDDKEIKNNKEEIVEQLSLDSDLVKELEQKFESVTNIGCDTFPEKYFQQDEFYFSSLIYEEKMHIIFNMNEFILKMQKLEINDSGYYVLTDDLINELKYNYNEMFGYDNELSFKASTDLTCPSIVVEGAEVRVFNECGCGPTGFVQEGITIKAEKTESEVKLYQKIGFPNIDAQGKYSISNEINGDKLFETNVDNYELLEEFMVNNKDKFNTYVITYKIDNKNNYYIYSLEKVKE